ncbi:hypothetical protein LTR97_011386 [Elasticomyces elasticus]|uniref:Uncharacterized protein n=1 Tax=Elasticomyces elasticus TaxID=574655 RepID=A0AAN7VY41_9PEZI|nr:hypothetical protein LTR97_011386 [Elasticomyces elasticus]
MVTKLSLLVHAGAPSKRSDDDRARILADAYLRFTGRLVSEQTYRIPELAVSQHHNDLEDGTKYPTQLLCSSPMAGRVEDEVSVSAVQPAYDDTTFLEDTQDAYAALESQLQTSSLAIPDITPLKRRLPESFDPDSPWPEDLDRHSPVKAAYQPSVHDEDVEEEHQSQQVSHEESPLQQRSQQVFPEDVSRTYEPPSQVVDRPPKKPRLQQRRVPAAKPVFKPFRPPTITRAVSDQFRRAVTPEIPAQVLRPERKSASQTSESQNSYLKTPILVTPSQGWGAKGSKSHGLGVKVSETTRTGTEGVVKSLLPEFQERSSKGPEPAPYIPLPGDNGMGVAYVGDGTQELDPRTPSGMIGGGGGGGERHSQFSGSGSALDTTSELPTSYSLSEISEHSSRARMGLRGEERSVSDPGVIGSNSRGDGQGRGQGQGERLLGDGEDGTKARTQLGKEEVRRVDRGVLEKRTGCLIKAAPGTKAWMTAAATGPAPPANPKATKDTTSNGLPNAIAPPPSIAAAQSPFADLPLTIRPPEPEVAVGGFTTHLTPTLSWLASSDKIKDVYTPISVSRPIRPLERGHWLVDTSSWPTEAQIAYWRFLENKVGSGEVGWGVWCTRDGDEEVFGTVQVFCWGECVREVYLMLYVASTSRVRKCGLRWVDGEGSVVVRMRGDGVGGATING